jgi:hypothetical protein
MNHFDAIFENIDVNTGRLKTSIDALASLPTYAKHVIEKILKDEGGLNDEDVLLMLSDLPTASDETLLALMYHVEALGVGIEYTPEFERALRLYATTKLRDYLYRWDGKESFSKALVEMGFIDIVHTSTLFQFGEYRNLAKRILSAKGHFYQQFSKNRNFLEILAQEAEIKLGTNKNFYFTIEDGKEYFFANEEFYQIE